MFKFLFATLAVSVVLRGALWAGTFFAITPLLGPIPLLLGAGNAGAAVYFGDLVLSVFLAVATAIACEVMRQDRLWGYRLGLALVRGYVAVNALTALATGALVFRFGTPAFLVVPLALYVASAVVALVIARRLAADVTSAAVLGLAYLRSLSAAATGSHTCGA